jgi:pimeloyl-ACP methyl ester carboxylesterase
MKLNTNRLPGLVLTEHTFDVPLDHAKPQGIKIKVFGRQVVAPGKENEKLPWLLFLEGGPGFGSPRPMDDSGWLKAALKEFNVFFLDQRGTTERSTKIHAQTLAHLTPEGQAQYLTHFRSDSIVRDAEFIRKEIVGDKWSMLGQSYGGFCITAYLSIAPEGIKEAYITGGVPSIERHIDDVYRETCKFIIEKNNIYYKRYPQDEKTIKAIVTYINNNDVLLPCGEVLSARRFLCIGINFGFQNGYETVHYLIENAFIDTVRGPELSYTFLKDMEAALPFNSNPLFAILHESIYAQDFSTRWSADRLLAEYPEFNHQHDRVLFTGEMVFQWMFDEFEHLKPLKEAAEILAQKEDWDPLYNAEKLSENEVPVACAVYFNDMFVNKQYSQETIDFVPNMIGWYTSEYEHCGLRHGGEKLFSRLMGLCRGETY